MRRDLELWARHQVEHAGWCERSTWFNVRMRDLERYMDALRREVPEVIEQRPPYTLEDVRQTMGAVLATMRAIENRLVALEEARNLRRPRISAHR